MRYGRHVELLLTDQRYYRDDHVIPEGPKDFTATWKMLCNQTIMAQMLLDLRSYPDVPALFQKQFYFKLDQWDGYRSERARLLGELAKVRNLVVLTGDIHAFYASELREDFDDPTSSLVRVEFVLVDGKAVLQPTFDGKVERLRFRTPSGSKRIEQLTGLLTPS